LSSADQLCGFAAFLINQFNLAEVIDIPAASIRPTGGDDDDPGARDARGFLKNELPAGAAFRQFS
jgi:hypothetical protein